MRKIILYLFFCLYFVSNNISCVVATEQDIDNHIASFFADNDKLIKSAKTVGKAAKYTSMAICVLFALNGVKKTIDFSKSLLPVDRELKLTDFIKFPFKLLAFPLKVIEIGRCFFISCSFGAASYALYKVGA